MPPKTRVKYVAAGFRNDIETLFDRYFAMDSHEFRNFATCWRETGFGNIFCGRVSDREMHELIDECYLITLTQLTQEKPLVRRIAALYLLYAIYNKQPMDDRQAYRLDIKIRVDQVNLLHLRQLFSDCKESHMMNPCYVWLKLLSQDAIHFVCFARTNVGPSSVKNIRIVGAEEASLSSNLVMELYSNVKYHLDEVKEMHEKYVTMKALQENANAQRINIITCDFTEDALSKLNAIRGKFARETIIEKRGRPAKVKVEIDLEDEGESHGRKNISVMNEMGEESSDTNIDGGRRKSGRMNVRKKKDFASNAIAERKKILKKNDPLGMLNEIRQKLIEGKEREHTKKKKAAKKKKKQVASEKK